MKNNMEPGEPGAEKTTDNSGMESWYQLPPEEDPSQLASAHPAESGREYRASINPSGVASSTETRSTQLQLNRSESLHLEFQDSSLSPALPLQPHPGKTLPFSDSTLFHQTETEFAPLRGSPDFSLIPERWSRVSHGASLSQHPLGETAALSEDGSSCCSLSQHSLSPGDRHLAATEHSDEKRKGAKKVREHQMEGEEMGAAVDRPKAEDAGWFLSRGVPARSLLELLEKDMGMAASSSSAVSSASENAVNQAEHIPDPPSTSPGQPDQPEVIPQHSDPTPELTSGSGVIATPEVKATREQPQGGPTSSSSAQRKSSHRVTGATATSVSEASNITVRLSHTLPDHSADVLRWQLLSESQRSRVSAPGSHSADGRTVPTGPCVTPAGSARGTGQTGGLLRALWTSANQTGTDGSFLNSQPVSQSTPAVIPGKAPQALAKLSPIFSLQDPVASGYVSTQGGSSQPELRSSLEMSSAVSPPPPSLQEAPSTETPAPPNQESTPSVPEALPTVQEAPPLDSATTLTPPPETDLGYQSSSLAAGRVRSLPSLSYMQKVDAWKANQSSNQSFYNNMAPQGFDGLSSKRKAQDSVWEGLNSLLYQHSTSRAVLLNSSAKAVTHAPQPMPAAPLSGASSPRRGDAVGGVAAGPSSLSPLACSVSHSSSLSTVITSIQQDTAPHSQVMPAARSDDIIPALDPASIRSSQLPNEDSGELPPTVQSGSGPAKPDPFLSLGHFSDVSSNRDVNSTFSSSQGSFLGEKSFRASFGAASSVVSLEVDNYAPYWTSKPSSPPQHGEFNIEDRIPLYLRNLGIDQSPSSILTPFVPHGPIREPEFSPTDVGTIKGSIGTPTKSTQPSEGGSPPKETISSSSLLSTDSEPTQTSHPPVDVSAQDRPTSQASPPDAPPDTHTLPQPSQTPDPGSPHQGPAPVLQREGSYGLAAELTPYASPPRRAWEETQEEDSSLVGSGTLQEIRRLLGQAQTLVSGHSSLASSPGSLRYSGSDTSLLRSRQGYHDDSSLSAGGNLSLLWARSSSDSALKESTSSSCAPLHLMRQTGHVTQGPSGPSQVTGETLKPRDIRVTPRRAEPEGCSAADPDKAGPVRLSVMPVNAPSLSPQQSLDQDTGSAAFGSSESSPAQSPVEEELRSFSDSSSESSLAARVARLLQSESPVSMVMSRPSTADPEDSRAREWILMKVSGRQCEALELNAEDRKRIEEIKRELLLSTKHKWSSDSEASTQSSTGVLSQHAAGFTAVPSAEGCLSEQMQRDLREPPDASTTLHQPHRQDLEARVRQIALREGLRSPGPLTSITIATTRRTPSPQPPPHHPPTHHHCAKTAEPNTAHAAPHLHSGPASKDTHGEPEDGEKVTQPATEPGEGMEVMQEDGEMERGSNTEGETGESFKDGLQIEPAAANVDDVIVPESRGHHFSQIHLKLSPKPARSDNIGPLARHPTIPTNQGILGEDSFFGPDSSLSNKRGILHKPSASTQTHSGDSRELREHHPDMAGTSVLISSRYPQSFTPPQRLAGPSRPLSIHTGTVPALLPYKPPGSAELFYVPQTDSPLSPIRSDSTMESSHPGSDDAVPPQFTVDVLGSRGLEDEVVTPKHTEGIYSKRAAMKRGTSGFLKQPQDLHGDLLIAPRGANSPIRGQDVRDRPTIAPRHSSVLASEELEEEFAPLHMEADYSMDQGHHQPNTVRKRSPLNQTIRALGQTERQDPRLRDLSEEIGSSLDQLWRRFSAGRSLEETRPANEGEVSLLERLERLSRLINSTSHSSEDKQTTHTQSPTKHQAQGGNRKTNRKRDHGRKQGEETKGRSNEKEQVRKINGGVPHQAWEEPVSSNQTGEEEEVDNLHHCPAERDESASISMETSSSMSTVDTQRLLRAFGPRVNITGGQEVSGAQGSKGSDSLSRLYRTIQKQKRGRSKPGAKHTPAFVPTDTISTDESSASADSLSTSSTYSITSDGGPAPALITKRPKVKLVSRGVQAGGVEIVAGATRRHTRDVGTTFPSPGSGSDARAGSAPASGGAAQLGSKREGRSKSSLTQYYPLGVSWFVSAEELKSESRKENQPERRAWRGPFGRAQPWREPLRQRHLQRHLQPPAQSTAKTQTPPEAGGRHTPAALVRLSLQEALELRRPEFVSRSRERMKRLDLFVEERKLQAVFNREREELFNRPGPPTHHTPAPAPVKPVIPKREMIQRSKQIYAQLPEVQRRREEERRKAEYRTYRLNAQLFNKRVTNQVLGRRTPWQ